MYLLQFFKYEHLPAHLQEISKPFAELAHQMAGTLPANPETSMAIRKLLEAKDCAVRSALGGSEPTLEDKVKGVLIKAVQDADVGINSLS